MTPALIDALQGFHGVTIRVRHPLAQPSMRLLDTLGARVVVDPEAPPCVAIGGRNEDTVRPTACPECLASEPP